MKSETMTVEERVMCAIRLEKPDRVPIAPLMDAASACTLAGKSHAQVYAEGRDAMLQVCLEAFEKYGGWDAIPSVAPADAKGYSLLGLKVLPPVEDRKELQILEEVVLQENDYDTIADQGWTEFSINELAMRVYDWGDIENVWDDAFEFMGSIVLSVEAYLKQGAMVLFPTYQLHPFFQLSMTRSMLKFTEDLYYRGDKVEAAIKKMVPEFIEAAVKQKAAGFSITGCIEERAGSFFYPPAIFERFWWPFTQEIVNALWSEGIVTWFHLDTNWLPNLEYFKQLPRGSAVIGLDGTTDIFAVKELLRDHVCISTDVHPTLLSLGTPEEVEAYTKKLIDEVGADGGMILSSGCWLPAAIKPDNFRAMIDTGKTYEFSQ
jgi:uroporphyrinogen-III decarboxylase